MIYCSMVSSSFIIIFLVTRTDLYLAVSFQNFKINNWVSVLSKMVQIGTQLLQPLEIFMKSYDFDAVWYVE